MKKIRILFATLAVALGLFFCISMVSVNAEEVATDTTNTQEIQEEETTTENEENAVVEAPNKETVEFFIDWVKNLKFEDFEAIIGWIIAYLVLNFSTIVGFVVTMIIKRVNESKKSKAFQEAFAKLSLENQQKIESLISSFQSNLEEVNKANNDLLQEYRDKIVSLQNENTKAVADELKGITDLLK